MLNILRGQDEQNDGASLLMEIIIFMYFCGRRQKLKRVEGKAKRKYK